MAKRWKKREVLAVIPLDKEGWSLRVFRITWLDDSQCIQLMKYATMASGTAAPYYPLQYVQVPLGLWDNVLSKLPPADLAAAAVA